MTIGYNPFDEDFNLEEFHEYRTMALSLREEKLRLLKRLDELKEDNRQLQEQVDELTDKLGKVLSGIKMDELLVAKGIEQVFKDTAKEIYGEIGDILVVETQEYGEIEVVSMERLKEIIKRKGVEVD